MQDISGKKLRATKKICIYTHIFSRTVFFESDENNLIDCKLMAILIVKTDANPPDI